MAVASRGGMDAEPSSTSLQPDERALAQWMRRQGRIWEVVVWPLIVVDVVLGIMTWQAWPDRSHVPTHIGSHGVDGWGSATGLLAIDLILPLVAVLAGPVLSRLLPLMPMDMANCPHPEYWKTAARWPISLAIVRVFLLSTATAVMVLVCATQVGFLAMAHGHPFPITATWICLGLLGLQTTLGITGLLRAHRPPAWFRGSLH